MTNVNEQRAAVIQRVFDEWAAEVARRVRPDAQYAIDGESQYAKGLVALSASTPDRAESHRRVGEAQRGAGLPETV